MWRCQKCTLFQKFSDKCRACSARRKDFGQLNPSASPKSKYVPVLRARISPTGRRYVPNSANTHNVSKGVKRGFFQKNHSKASKVEAKKKKSPRDTLAVKAAKSSSITRRKGTKRTSIVSNDIKNIKRRQIRYRFVKRRMMTVGAYSEIREKMKKATNENSTDSSKVSSKIVRGNEIPDKEDNPPRTIAKSLELIAKILEIASSSSNSSDTDSTQKRMESQRSSDLEYEEEIIKEDSSDDFSDSEEDIIMRVPCRMCRSAETPKGNDMVFCDRCFSCYHQRCHPKLEKIPSGNFHCLLCSRTDYDEYNEETKRMLEKNHSLPWNEKFLEPWRKEAEIKPEVAHVYKVINKATGELGGNADGGAIYGEMTMTSFQKVIDALKANADLCETSKILDIGAGLGKPNFHLAVNPGVALSVGIEVMPVRWQLSLFNLKYCLEHCSSLKNFSRHKVGFLQADITTIKSFNSFTHIYMYDVAFTPMVMRAISHAFNQSSCKYLVSYHKPMEIIWQHGFLVKLISSVPGTAMVGSGRQKTAWIYERTEIAPTEKEEKTDEPDALENFVDMLEGFSKDDYQKYLERHLNDTLLAENTNCKRSSRRKRAPPLYFGVVHSY